MRLLYRGVSYEYEPTAVDMSESGVSGQYRGRCFQFAYPRHIPVPQPVVNLKYRGVAYKTTATGGIEAIAPATPKKSAFVFERARNCSTPSIFATRRATMGEVAKIHSQNIQRRLQHRLEVAKAKGDQALIRQLEQEMRLTMH